MTHYFVTRHKGAIDWAKEQKIDALHMVHFNPEIIKSGDVVLGTLPVPIVAKICTLGACYFHLTLDLPAEARGRELTADDMNKFNARLEEYTVSSSK